MRLRERRKWMIGRPSSTRRMSPRNSHQPWLSRRLHQPPLPPASPPHLPGPPNLSKTSTWRRMRRRKRARKKRARKKRMRKRRTSPTRTTTAGPCYGPSPSRRPPRSTRPRRGCGHPSAASWDTSTPARPNSSTRYGAPTCRRVRPAASHNRSAPRSSLRRHSGSSAKRWIPSLSCTCPACSSSTRPGTSRSTTFVREGRLCVTSPYWWWTSCTGWSRRRWRAWGCSRSASVPSSSPSTRSTGCTSGRTSSTHQPRRPSTGSSLLSRMSSRTVWISLWWRWPSRASTASSTGTTPTSAETSVWPPLAPSPARASLTCSCC
mmetsp:Transcript_36534/g.91433  ORF Transcript_36534/g.91433 Transcript_36534/m.91433 type:complete len:320 (+) Transcript_36534:749-1708(+)